MSRLLFCLSCVYLLAGLVDGQLCGGTCECRGVGSTCCLMVEENSEVGTPVGLAVSQDGENQFAITNQDNQDVELFQIDSTNGNITVNIPADREVHYCALIFVSAGGNMFPVVIDIIDINDNEPEFNSPIIEIIVPETRSGSNLVCNQQLRSALSAADNDTGANSEITYSLRNTDLFTIDNPTTPCITNTRELDFDDEQYQPFQFTIVATDQGDNPLEGTAQVILSLTGVNEFPPVIQENEVSFREMQPPGAVVQRLIAEDMDRSETQDQIRFAILNSGPNRPFVINATTGEITTTEELDAEDTNLQRTLNVEACDSGGLCSIKTVAVMVGDVNEPADFTVAGSVTELCVDENTMKPALVFLRINDRDSFYTNNSIEIVFGGEKFNKERFDPSTFLINQIAPIDRETETPLNLTLRLIEEGDPQYDNQTLTFLIKVRDMNDNAPELSQTSFEYTEEEEGFVINLGEFLVDPDEGANAEIASVVLVTAFSAENLISEFNKSNGGLNLGPDGILSVPRFDREKVGDIITVTIDVQDNGSTPMTANEIGFQISIQDVNDNAPTFNNSITVVTIDENLFAGHRTSNSITATDEDSGENGRVIYLLESNDFRINENGELFSRRSFDRENITNYTLTISARDNGTVPRFANLNLTVTVLINDMNDNLPVIEGIMEEIPFEHIPVSTKVETIIGKVKATDKDDGDNAVIEYSLVSSSNYFEISSQGVIRVATALVFNKDRIENVTVRVKNPESSIYVTATFVIIVRQPFLTETDMIVIGVSVFVILVILLLLLIGAIFCYCKKKTRTYDLDKPDSYPNNVRERVNSITKPILKSVPAASANGITAGRERVQVKFSDRVDETHYEPQGAVTDDKVLRKESITNFGHTESPQAPTRGSPVHNGIVPASPTAIMDLEHSPGQHMNGITNDIGMHPIQSYEMHRIRPHSPMNLRREMTDNGDYSGSTTDVNSYNSGDSTFSDGASNMNTSIPCFPKDEHPAELHARYGPPPSHPPMYPHIHSHTSHMPSSNLLNDIIYPGKMSSLAADDSYTSSQGNGFTSRHSQNPSNSDSSQTTTPSPHPRHERMNRIDPGSVHQIHSHSKGVYTRPLVMPDAYPQPPPLPDIHRPSYPSLSDFEETSTYASMELDEALHCDYDAEPDGFYSLTATDYGDHEDT